MPPARARLGSEHPPFACRAPRRGVLLAVGRNQGQGLLDTWVLWGSLGWGSCSDAWVPARFSMPLGVRGLCCWMALDARVPGGGLDPGQFGDLDLEVGGRGVGGLCPAGCRELGPRLPGHLDAQERVGLGPVCPVTWVPPPGPMGGGEGRGGKMCSWLPGHLGPVGLEGLTGVSADRQEAVHFVRLCGIKAGAFRYLLKFGALVEGAAQPCLPSSRASHIARPPPALELCPRLPGRWGGARHESPNTLRPPHKAPHTPNPYRQPQMVADTQTVPPHTSSPQPLPPLPPAALTGPPDTSLPPQIPPPL